MKVGLLTSQTPFVRGGAEAHAAGLRNALREFGHEAEIISMPFRGYPPEILLDQMLAARLLDVQEVNGQPIDRVIGLKFPAYLMRHPRKVIWLLHQHRAVYDLWGSAFEDLHLKPIGDEIRRAVKAADELAFQESKMFANSRAVAERVRKFNGLTVPPLHHPPPLLEMLRAGDDGPYLYYPSRITSLKRQSIVIEALARCRLGPRVVFSGGVEDEWYSRQVLEIASRLGVEKSVTFLGHVTDAKKVDLLSNCGAVIYVPYDEDYGYVPLEAMMCAKPVLTCRDSGGGREFVEHEVTGLVSEPTSEGLAESLDRCWSDAQARRRWGTAGRARLAALDLSWNKVVEALLE